MTTFKDFLIYYNNLDVRPFVSAVEKMQQFYFKHGVDLFKVAVSVPGIARQCLFKTAHDTKASFALIHPKDDDLYNPITSSVVPVPFSLERLKWGVPSSETTPNFHVVTL